MISSFFALSNFDANAVYLKLAISFLIRLPYDGLYRPQYLTLNWLLLNCFWLKCAIHKDTVFDYAKPVALATWWF